ncbi:MAG: radical SAM protein [Candidatus Pacearchaeota archaeon]
MNNAIADSIEERFLEFIKRGEPPLDYERQLVRDQKKRIEAILRGENPPPYEVEIQPSSKCNLACEHCFGKCYKRLPNLLGKKEIKRIAEEIRDFQENGFKIEVAKFCGTTGEPLLNSTIAEGIDLFREMRKKIIVFTNGLWLDQKVDGRNETYSDCILKADKLNLSLDAGSEETFFRIKKVHGFDRIIKSLEQLVKRREVIESKLKIIISYVIGEENYHEVVPTTRLIKDIGADEIVFRVDFTNPENITRLSREIIGNLRAAREYRSPNFKIISPYSESEISDEESGIFTAGGKRCFNRYFWASIGPDCNLYACGHRTHGGVRSYGNLLEKSFRELWNSEKRLKDVKDLPDEHCIICSPSSMRRNDFMTFLASLPFIESQRLLER